jgi:hypothetical protein|tara:strand:+ start:2536 stop:2988 length:453 start_codon:yes stop_codon:yes gene_type:complete
MKTILILGLILSQNLISQNSLSKEQAFNQVVELIANAEEFNYDTDINVLSSNFKKLSIEVKAHHKQTIMSSECYEYTYLLLDQLENAGEEYSDFEVELKFKTGMKNERKFVKNNFFNAPTIVEENDVIIELKTPEDAKKLIFALNVLLKD